MQNLLIRLAFIPHLEQNLLECARLFCLLLCLTLAPLGKDGVGNLNHDLQTGLMQRTDVYG